MAKGFNGALLHTLGAKDHVLTVTGKEWLTDNFLRVHFTSETLLDDSGEAPAAWMRAWFPDPDGGSKQFQRGYTFAETDPENGTLAVDFVIHSPAGPASYWALHCEPGDEIEGMRYGEEPFTLLDPAPEGYLLLGDLASYPAVTQLAAAIPEDIPVVVYLEKHSEADAQSPLPEGPNITAAWVDELPDGQTLVQAIGGRDWTGWYAWVTAESTATRHARTVLQREYHLNRGTLHAQAYWVAGRAMGKSRALQEHAEQQEKAAQEKAQDAPAPQQDAPAAAASGTPHEKPQEKATGVLAPAKTALIISGLVQGLLSIVGIVPFILFADLARQFLAGTDQDSALSTGITAVVIMGVSALGSGLLMLAMHLYDASYASALRRRLMGKFRNLPLGWFLSRQTADTRKLVTDDVAGMHYIVTHAVPDLVAAIVTPLATLIYLFVVDWRLGLVLLLPIIAYIYVMVSIQNKERDRVVTSQRNMSLIAGQAQSFTSTLDVAKVFGASSIVDLPGTLKETGAFTDKLQRDTGPIKIIAVMINRPTTVLGLLIIGGFLLMLPDWVSANDLVPFLILGPAFGAQLVAISGGVGTLLVSLDSRSTLDLTMSTPELTGPVEGKTRPVPSGHVVFDHVRFGYTPDRDVLPDLSLKLEPGTVTAVVGPSGAGKSTVGMLLARLWDPVAGSISIDGTDLRDMTQDELYAKVTILLQDVQLIHASIRDNIALTRPEATDEQIVTAAKAAHIHEVIMTLPEGYDTIVDADRLSGGERQRLGIARALLADTPVVVLDEATAAADPDSEWAILQGLDELLRGRTVLMIAHRLHTIAGADQILVLDQGRVTESGTHADLLAAKGSYADLWNISEVH
ncbi:MAG TPA: ATP-binding cassette domain-containing protein [Candidatus Corynebacterium avicola]|uniref:Mycobactin import ATP-binding/permease protein IrtA n=1 Tax=Candidatus Corynebacterium avicola TaxID=2838527 RepID=A0A9D1RT14_9CORY|nr:ATP-binding cassette domain-containing protein [Candidatus Corynebacterium avicola]